MTMRRASSSTRRLWGCVFGLMLAGPGFAAGGDFDGSGFVDLFDYSVFEICLSASGAEQMLGLPACLGAFDYDADADVDLADFSTFQRSLGHTPMPLMDYSGNPITVDSTQPYSGRHTCGRCHEHDADTVAGGAWFQDGMTDADGNLDMRDDYNDDGRFWIKSAARYGKWGQSFFYLLAAKNNTHPSQIDQTAFAWIRDCSGCHPGGGPGERDRYGQFLWDGSSFGHEHLPVPPANVALDGDYGLRNPDGSLRPAPWDVTGLSGPDCLMCHRADRPKVGATYKTLDWRRNTLAAGDTLVDNFGNPVPAFAAAGTAGQGWFSNLVRGQSPPADTDGGWSPADRAVLEAGTPGAGARATTKLQIDYQVGVENHSLVLDEVTGQVSLAPASLAYPPLDQACWDCHPYGTITGTVWFDQRDVHYKKFNNLSDEDPDNDIPPAKSTACTYCHPGDVRHNVAKGHSHQLQYRNELDWDNFRSCRDCHLSDSPNRHPDAPRVALADLNIHTDPMFSLLSCQACHIPYPLYPPVPTVLFRDITLTANAALNPGGNVGTTARYYSADPVDPTNPDKSRWYPALCLKEDSDGAERWFPCNIWISHYFGDWNDNGTPEDYADDTITPVFLWRQFQAAGEAPRPILRDDDADGRLEINQPDELLDYFAALKGNDLNGVQVAANPVLVRGQRVWYQDSPTTVASFDHVGKGIAMNPWYQYIWGLDHNVLVKEEAWGYDSVLDPKDGCNDCHRPLTHDSPVFDRKILVDSIDLNNLPVYQTVREMTGLNPEQPVETP